VFGLSLDKRLWFPDPRRAVTIGSLNGLVAVGGDLSVERLTLAYRSGIFPWSVDPITWWSPDPRGILELDHFHVSRSLRKKLRQEVFAVTRDRAFRAVMEGCAAPGPNRHGTWISPEFIEAYSKLHEAGHAHSVECWHGTELAGGVYGVEIGACFCAESMFHRRTDASKVALYHLAEHLRDRGFDLLDIQMVTPHTRQLGATTLGRNEYLDRLERAVLRACPF
jgi:leucyl/phenylalanyl-tRNA--protein transferase